jgi:type II secretory pathway component PulF
MAQFSYRALNKAGELVTGNFEAGSKEEASAKLSKLNYTPLSLEKKGGMFQFNFSPKAKVKPNTILILTKQLQSLIKAGVPLLEALHSLQEQSSDENLQKVLKSVTAEIEMGNTFSSALKKHPGVFSTLYTNSIQIGEVSGNLDAVLAEIALFMADDIKMKQNIKKATRYPTMVMIALALAFVVFITFVIPKFVPIFEKGGQELPTPTLMILGISELVTGYWLPLIGVIGICIFGFVAFYNTPKGKFKVHYYMLEAPIYGQLLRKISIQRFSRTLALLNKSGIPLVQAMEIGVKVETNEVYKEEINKIQQQIEKGVSVAGAMKKSKYFPILMVHMIAVGEKSGALDDMLYNVAEFNNSEIDQMVENLTALIEPIVTVFLGIMVLILALSIFLPMWNMLSFMK